uniref:Heme-copper oxidase subunit III family profile domain-containing protein n=1 Tax=Brassica oleracea var. oleracea TaxID=109376 RepID=A0A0D2ZS52_BRAOL
MTTFSGATITYGHHAFIKGDRKGALYGSIATVLLAVVFTGFQASSGGGDGNNGDNDSGYDDDSDDDSEDNDSVEDMDVVERDDHNAPEKIVDDLDLVDKAKQGDNDALSILKEDYPAFFDQNSDQEGLKQVEDYLEEEFPGELEKSEREADELDRVSRRNNGESSGDSTSATHGRPSGTDNGGVTHTPSNPNGEGSSTRSPVDYVIEKESTELPSF